MNGACCGQHSKVAVRKPLEPALVLLPHPHRPSSSPCVGKPDASVAVLATSRLFPKDELCAVDLLVAHHAQTKLFDPIVLHEADQRNFDVGFPTRVLHQVVGTERRYVLRYFRVSVRVVLAVARVEAERDVPEHDLRAIHHALPVRPDPEEEEENRFSPPRLGILLRRQTADLDVVVDDAEDARD